jgi:hypothetical protein
MAQHSLTKRPAGCAAQDWRRNRPVPLKDCRDETLDTTSGSSLILTLRSIVIGPQRRSGRRAQGFTTGQWTLAAFSSAQLRVVKPDYATQNSLRLATCNACNGKCHAFCMCLCLAKYNVFVQIENANRAYQNAKVAMYAKKSYPEPYRGNAGERRNPIQPSRILHSAPLVW